MLRACGGNAEEEERITNGPLVVEVWQNVG